MEAQPSAPPHELAEFLRAEAPQGFDMLSFLADLGDDDNENLGDEVDLDEVLARELQRQEDELEAQRQHMEESDREFARVESERDSLFGLSVSQEARDQAFAAALAQEERDQEVAARLAREEQSSLARSAEARAAADYAFALSLQEAESGPRPSEVSASDRALALAMVEAEREEQEMRNRRALQAQQREKDEAFAKKLLQREQEEFAREEYERTRAAALPGEADTRLPPAPVVDLTRSKEGLLNESEHAEFLVGCDLSYLRAYLAAHKGCVVRPVVNAALRSAFVARRERMHALGGPGRSQIHLAFHGTKIRHLRSIESGGLKVPGSNGVNHESDSGWWGKGIYSSYDPNYSSGYAEGGKLIVIAVLLGRPYRITQRRDGGACEPGFDSHLAEDGREYVCFHDDQVLPLFVIDTQPKIVAGGPPPFKKPPVKKPVKKPGWKK